MGNTKKRRRKSSAFFFFKEDGEEKKRKERIFLNKTQIYKGKLKKIKIIKSIFYIYLRCR